MAGDASSEAIPANSKVFVQPGEFGNFIIAALQKKKVPLVLVADEATADYIISGTTSHRSLDGREQYSWRRQARTRKRAYR
jgi:hypothetical protein